MKSISILSAKLNEETGFIEVVKMVANEDETVEFAGHSFHPETLEWWSAIYGIDDKDELIDIIMYEPYIENISPMNMTEEEARDSHRQKINTFKKKHGKTMTKDKAKQSIEMSDVSNEFAKAAADADPYEFIKGSCPFDKDVIDAKRKHINQVREHNRQERSMVKQDSVTRVNALNRKLQGPRQAKEVVRPKITNAPPAIVLEKGKRKHG